MSMIIVWLDRSTYTSIDYASGMCPYAHASDTCDAGQPHGVVGLSGRCRKIYFMFNRLSQAALRPVAVVT
jgi:hypothetical protein